MSPAAPCCVPYNQRRVLNLGAHARLSGSPQEQNSPENPRVPQLHPDSDSEPPLLVPGNMLQTDMDVVDMAVVDIDEVDTAVIPVVRNTHCENTSCINFCTCFFFCVLVWLYIIFVRFK